MTCSICKKDNSTLIYNLNFLLFDSKHKLINVPIYCCNNCDFVFYRHSHINELYSSNSKYGLNDTGSGANKDWDTIRLKNSFEIVSKYRKLNKSNDKIKLLDVGCANGVFLRLFDTNTEELYGMDFKINQDYVKDLLDNGVQIKETIDLNHFKMQYNFITVLHVLEHIDDVYQFVNSIISNLEYGGYVYFEVPNAFNYDNYFTSPFGYFDLEHINHFTKQSLFNLMNQFEDIEILDFFEGDFFMSSTDKYPYLGVVIQKKIRKRSLNLSVNNFSSNNKESNEILKYIDHSAFLLNKYSYKKSFNNVVIYGVGANTLRTISLLELDVSGIKYFIDKNENFHGRQVLNKEVFDISKLLNDINKPDVIIFSKIYFEEIKYNLKEKGYLGNIYNFF